MRYRNEPIYTGAIGVGRAMFGALRLKPTVIGAQHLPDEGGAVIAMTHFGYMEFALVEWVTWLHNRRRIRFMAKKPVFDKKPIGALMRNMKHISVDMKAGAGAYAAAITALQAGELIGVFPEAGVSASFTIRELKTGAARLAAEAGVPLIPMVTWGTQLLKTKDHPSDLKGRGKTIGLHVGEPLQVTGEDPVAETARLREAMTGLLDRAIAEYPVRPEGQWWAPSRHGGTAPTLAEARQLDEQEYAARAARRNEPQ